MCNIWKNNATNEISPEEISKVLSAAEFRHVKHLGISGGEPTLRKDLVRCVEAIVNALPMLETLSITSHGYSSSRWRRFLPLIKQITSEKGVDFSLNISMDGYGVRHDMIRGIDGAFIKSSRTIELAKELGVRLQLQYTISTMNVYSMQMALSHARALGVEIIFRLATNIERLYNADRSEVFIGSEERSFVADFFSSEELLSQTRSLSRKLYYDRMGRWLTHGGGREMPCYFQDQGILLTSNLQLYPCSIATKPAAENLRSANYVLSNVGLSTARQHTKDNYCSSCIHDQSGAWSPFNIVSYKVRQLKLFRVVKKLLRFSDNIVSAAMLRFRLAIGKIPVPLVRGGVTKATIIGAYGGEHVGDAAILGGVILRLKEKFDTRHFTILSFRPARTLKWVQSLKIEGVEFNVVTLSKRNLRSSLKQSDGLAYAGGPIMDIPVNLSFYLYASLLARKKGLPFVVEGVGLGPYKRTVSKYLASLMLMNSAHTTLRSQSNLDSLPNHAKLHIEKVGRDPAFDYLDYYRNLVGGLNYSARERGEISALDDYIADRQKVLFVNLRPIWSAYALKGTEGTVSSVVERSVAELSEFVNGLDKEWAVVLIPFNPDTYGFSDFSSFYDLVAQISPSRDFYTVEYEPGVPLMLELLARCTHLLAMRFHACIFGISSGKDVYGIDYQIGGKGKVAGLFESIQSDNYSNVGALTAGNLRHWVEL
ncbi:polysaccharide pyruvyl transferase family protein [Pseudomonas sp. HD6421]|nr:polysaccharide pyruvyl transferase family protein [Pseudomonas sp. HD6422]MCT8185537.1 polysaccharide pyruvyl transferase family protein [Pseudomonas sp. HD6421]